MPKALVKPAQLPALKDSAYQIWLAGLGALSIAEDESGKIFQTLVKRGRTFEASTKDRLVAVKDKLDMRKTAADTFGRVTDTLDEGVSGVLGRLGLPTKKEIDGLSKRVERLTKAIEEKPVRHTRRATTTRRRAKATA
jgi:poly(hydroxyalkanoate) granule-associated protein